MIPYEPATDVGGFGYDENGNRVYYEPFVCQLVKEMNDPATNIHHMATGVAGEGGELLDASKKQWIYGKELDRENVIEELGDIEFYMAGLRQMLGITRDEVLNYNIRKLLKRYPTGYTDNNAIARKDKQLQVIDVTQPAKAVSDSDVAAMDSQAGDLR